VVDGLRTVANAARQAQPAARPAEAAARAASPAGAAQAVRPEPTGVLAQGDFQTLLASAQKTPLDPAAAGTSAQDRSQVAAAMAAGGMGEVDIARHLGASREEIRLMLSNPNGADRAAWSSVKAYWR
jgi:hypothetical protein